MSSFIRIEMNPDLEEGTAEALSADGAHIARFTPASTRAPSGTAGLRVPMEPLECIWAALENAHHSLNRDCR